MSNTVHIQLGLFPGCAEVADMHVVSAHTRMLSDGSAVFVGEHLRWNTSRPTPRFSAPRATPVVNQPGLFDEQK